MAPISGLPLARPPPGRPPELTLAIGADGAALARGHGGTGTVVSVLTPHYIAQDFAFVAHTDLAGMGFPHIPIIVPEAVLYAGDWWDWWVRRWGEEGGDCQ